jgi:hypothetical protein
MFRCVPSSRRIHDEEPYDGYFNPYVNSWSFEANAPVTVRFSLRDRLILYAFDLKNLSSSPVKGDIFDDPFLLPADYFTDEEKKSMLQKYDYMFGKTYQQALEEIMLDRRGQMSTATDILPLVKRYFQVTRETLESDKLANKHRIFHRELRRQRSFKVEDNPAVVEYSL